MSLPSPTRTDRVGLSFGEYYAPHDCFHPGIDFNWGVGNQDLNQPVIAVTHGVVEYVSPQGYNGGLGNYVVIYHPWHGVWTRYLHLEKVFVTVGEMVVPDQVIALLGDEGTTSAHLHFEVLNWLGLSYIKDLSRPYGRYPRGLPLKQMLEKWIDPIAFLETNSQPSIRSDALRKRLEKAQKDILKASAQEQRVIARLIRRLTARIQAAFALSRG